MIIRVLWVVRISLEDDGVIGQIMEGTFYRTITAIRKMLLTLMLLLWVVETVVGQYTRDPMGSFMRETFYEPGHYGPLGQALQHPHVQTLNEVGLAWFAVDMALGMLYSVLDRLTLEEHEKAQRENEKIRERLGDTEGTEGDRADCNFLISMVESWPFRYIQCAAIAVMVLNASQDIVGVATDVATSVHESGMPEISQSDLAKVNPHRDLLPEQDGVLRELVYMSHVLRQLNPTTLPDDDHQLFSDMIRSLETRTGISWRTYEETDVRETIMAAANRENRHGTVLEEPFFINERVKALHNHWHELALAPEKPERWEDASDSTFLKPLVATNSLGEPSAKLGGGRCVGAISSERWECGGFKLALTLEQEEEATIIYTEWRQKRDRKVSYLKLYPPRPMAWVPIAKSDTGIRNAWDTATRNIRVRAGQKVDSSKLVGSKQWKPIFRSLMTEYIPIGWVPPGEEPQVAQDPQAVMEHFSQQTEIAAERRAKQQAELRRLIAKGDAERQEKLEL